MSLDFSLHETVNELRVQNLKKCEMEMHQNLLFSVMFVYNQLVAVITKDLNSK